MINESVNMLEKLGYYGIDANINESLFEYGVIRNPSNNHTIFCNGYEEDARFRHFEISVEDVMDDLEKYTDKGFYDTNGTSEEEYKKGINNEYLVNAIRDLESYYGIYTNGDYPLKSKSFIEMVDNLD